MKKLVISLTILLLGVAGLVNAAGIPTAVDPQNTPEVWTMEVYNAGTAALTSGTVVCWDFNSVTTPAAYTDRVMRVIGTSTTNDDIRVAGVVVDASIPAAGVGTIAIWGPVYALCANSSDALTASHAVGQANGVAGQCGDSAGGTNTATLGYCIAATSNTAANGGMGGGVANTSAVDFIMFPIMVDPGRE